MGLAVVNLFKIVIDSNHSNWAHFFVFHEILCSWTDYADIGSAMTNSSDNHVEDSLMTLDDVYNVGLKFFKGK